MALPVLRYFDVPGRAVVIRLAFELTGQKFEDKRFTHEVWPTEKPEAPFLQVPYLTVEDGTKLPQTNAILFYVFEKAGKLPTCPLARALNLAMVLQCDDSFLPLIHKWFKTPEDKRDAVLPEMYEHSKEVIPMLEKFVAKHEGGRGFFHGTEVSPADLAIAQSFRFGPARLWNEEKADALIKDAPAIKRIVDKISSLPAVKSHKDVQAKP